MGDFKPYFKNLIGFDMIVIAAFLFICGIVGFNEEIDGAYEAISLGLPALFITLIATILVCIGMYVIDEL